MRAWVLLAGLLAWPAWADSCRGTLYLTLDSGNMAAAESIADVLSRHHVKATFFVTNKPTFRGDHTLDDSWGAYWRARVADGHRFGSHTWRHWYLRQDLPDGRIAYVSANGETEQLDQAAFCAELQQVDRRFQALTGKRLDPLWRAPGGRVTPRSRQWAAACGYARHVGWPPAGFLGDELPSERYPNDQLLKRAFAHVRDGDILMMHLGIQSRHDPFARVFEPLIQGFQDRGFCFALLPE